MLDDGKALRLQERLNVGAWLFIGCCYAGKVRWLLIDAPQKDALAKTDRQVFALPRLGW